MKAVIEVECADAEKVLRAIAVDNSETEKFSVDIKAVEGKIFFEVIAKDISGLMAGINSNLKLIKLAQEACEI